MLTYSHEPNKASSLGTKTKESRPRKTNPKKKKKTYQIHEMSTETVNLKKHKLTSFKREKNQTLSGGIIKKGKVLNGV